MKQRSPEWYRARCGRITGTRFAAAMADPTSATYQSLVDQLVAERTSGRCHEIPLTAAMQWGIDHEPIARDWYSKESGNRVVQIGFVHHRSLDFVGVSPDGFVGDHGLVEIKCPQMKAYKEVADRRRVPIRYIWQVQGQLWVCERDFVDFVCFHPRVGGVIVRSGRDERRIAELREKCERVERDVQRRIAAGSGRHAGVSAPTTTLRPERLSAPSCHWPREQPAVARAVQAEREAHARKPRKRSRWSSVRWWMLAIVGVIVWYLIVH